MLFTNMKKANSLFAKKADVYELQEAVLELALSNKELRERIEGLQSRTSRGVNKEKIGFKPWKEE